MPIAYAWDRGNPIHTDQFGERIAAALRSLDVRARRVYTTRHTFNLALSRGANLKRIAEYCGTSVVMIERNYGRWLEDGSHEEDDRLFGLPGRDLGRNLSPAEAA